MKTEHTCDNCKFYLEDMRNYFGGDGRSECDLTKEQYNSFYEDEQIEIDKALRYGWECPAFKKA